MIQNSVPLKARTNMSILEPHKQYLYLITADIILKISTLAILVSLLLIYLIQYLKM